MTHGCRIRGLVFLLQVFTAGVIACPVALA